MELPPPLAPWKDCLAAVSPEVARTLGPWLLKLAPMVGPLRTRALPGAGEPDGYDGLVRRGPYERLLLSEWLLASEVPEEFVRRAAMRELGFHRMAYREPADARASVALFDAGPSQLGAPRLAHVAALLLLAQRAARAKARFGWGVLQRPPGDPAGGGLTLGVTAQNVDALLRARQASPPADADLDAWAAFEARGEGWADVWVIGPRDAWDRWRAKARRRPGATGGCLVVADTREADAQRVRVEVVQRSMVTSVTLTPPDDAACVRLLRSVAAPAAGASGHAPRASLPRSRRYTQAHTPVTNLVFSPTANVLAWRTRSGAMLLSAVPKYAGGHQEKLRMYVPRRGETFLAVGFIKRRVVVLSLLRDELLLYEWNGHHFPRPTAHRPWLPEGTHALRDRAATTLEPLFVYRPAPHQPFVAALRAPGGGLVRLDREAPRSLRMMNHGDVCVVHERLVIEEPFSMGGGVVSGPPLLEGIESVPSVPGPVFVSAPEQVDMALRVAAKTAAITVRGHRPSTVVRHTREREPAVVYTAEQAIVDATLHPRAGLLAFTTEGGGVFVVNAMGDRGALVAWTPEAS